MPNTSIDVGALPIILSRDCATSTERAAIRAGTANKQLTRIHRGVYVPTEFYAVADARTRYVCLAAAAELMSPTTVVFSHASAAALWRLPWVGAWPQRASVTVDDSQRRSSNSLVARHAAVALGDCDVIDGYTVTSLDRTVADLSAHLPFGRAVALADAALRRTDHPLIGVPRSWLTKEDLLVASSALPVNHGRAKALRVAAFADGRADRPGKSLSRATMLAARIPTPILQADLLGASGRRYTVDFWWPELKVFGEFDGWAKYEDPVFLAGRTPQEALRDEKRREDDLRAPGRGCARWDWTVAQSVPLLRARLGTAGVRPTK